MTVAVGTPTHQGWDETGLDDVEASDIAIPRLSIMHAEGRFKNNLTNEEFAEGEFIILGLVKQRIFWPSEVDGKNDGPLCKSPDFETGYANVDPEVPADRRFPWADSNFSGPERFPAHGEQFVKLPCASCKFKEWNTDGKNSKPPCSEQWTLPVMYRQSSSEGWQPALLSLHRSGLRPAKSYITAFAASKTPAFTVITNIKLAVQKRGSVAYSTPVFRKGGDTDAGDWLEYGASFRQIRQFIKEPPRIEGVEDSNIQDGEVIDTSDPWGDAPAAPATPAAPAAPAAPAPPAAAPTAPPQPPAAAPAPSSSTPAVTPSAGVEDDEDLPF